MAKPVSSPGSLSAPPELCDKFIAITPTTHKKLKEICKKHPSKPSFNRTVAAFIEAYNSDPLVNSIVNKQLGSV